MTTIKAQLSSFELETRARPRHPDAATEEDRAALKKNFRPRLPRTGASIRARPSKSGRWMNTASV